MCDNVAVRWSEYDEFRTKIEYETRNKISENLQTLIATVKESGISNHFYAGLLLANSIVLNISSDAQMELDESVQLPLG